MVIIGNGVDLIEIERISRAYQRFGERFLNRIFTEEEAVYCLRHRDPAPSLAARFAAKEAATKALGTGLSRGVRWRDVEVIRRGGPPVLHLHGAAARRMEEMGGRATFLTLTHARELALAHVLIVG